MNWWEPERDESQIDEDVSRFLREIRRREEEEARRNTIEAALEWLRQINEFIRGDDNKSGDDRT